MGRPESDAEPEKECLTISRAVKNRQICKRNINLIMRRHVLTGRIDKHHLVFVIDKDVSRVFPTPDWVNNAIRELIASKPKAEESQNLLAHLNFPLMSPFLTPLQPISSDLRILLWDIDGTLIRSTKAGSFKDYTIPMLEEVSARRGRLPEMKVSGMTDLQIVGEALKHEGFTHDHIRKRVHQLRESYMKAMHKFTGNGEAVFELLPGVREVLQAVDGSSALPVGAIDRQHRAGGVVENGVNGSG